jgi:O-antigen ligase
MMQVSDVSPEADPALEPASAIDPCRGRSPHRLDWILAFVAALILSDAFDDTVYVLFGLQARLVRGVPFARIPLIVVAAVTGILLARDPRDATAHLRGAWWLWPAVALAFVSALWSERPAATLVWATALLTTSAFGVALAVRFSALAQALLVVAVATAIALASVLSAAIWPAHALRGHQWRGIYAHRNLLGRTQALGVGAALVTILSQRHRVIAAGALCVCATLLLVTESRASALAAVVTVFATLLLLAARRWRRHATTILMAGTAAALLVLTLLVTTRSGLAVLERSETFTDRRNIWKSVAATAMEAPWLGHGYGAFWTSAAGDATWARSTLRDRINQAHNGALDLFAELGVAGIALVFVPLAIVAVAAGRHALAPRHPACLWPAVYLVFFMASNVAESALLRHKLYWAVYVAAACHVATAARKPLH